MQSNVEDYIEYNWFDHEDETGPMLIGELQNYDEVEIGSDNDLADAFGMALFQDISCEIRPMDLNATESENDRFKLSFERDSQDTNFGMLKHGEMDI